VAKVVSTWRPGHDRGHPPTKDNST
jgi:hypothetical protein